MKEKIDLTERGDFRSKNDTFSPRNAVIATNMYIDNEIIRLDVYDSIEWTKRIFGIRRHPNRKREILDDYEKLKRRWRSSCCMCGKMFRYPWENSYFGRCKECSDKEDGKIPWKHIHEASERNVSRDLFDSK